MTTLMSAIFGRVIEYRSLPAERAFRKVSAIARRVQKLQLNSKKILYDVWTLGICTSTARERRGSHDNTSRTSTILALTIGLMTFRVRGELLPNLLTHSLQLTYLAEDVRGARVPAKLILQRLGRVV